MSAYELDDRSVFRYRKQRGVNLGAWFVSERYFSSAHFHDGERSDLDIANGEDAKDRLEQHWDNWITDDDWQYLVDCGFNTVRLPIGYYHLAGAQPDLLEGTDFSDHVDTFSGAWERIEKAIEKAGEMGLGVVVDLHAAPGSQNTDSHSGKSDGQVALWFKDEDQGDYQHNLQKTKEALLFLAAYLSDKDHVVGLQLLNQPSQHEQLYEFYDEMIEACHEAAGNRYFPIYISDSFLPDEYDKYVGKHADSFVVMDHHLFRAFDGGDPPYRSTHGDQLADDLRNDLVHKFEENARNAGGRLVVHAFSAALDEGSFPEGWQTDPAEMTRIRKNFLDAQLEIFEKHGIGFCFWTLKMDHWDEGWCLMNARETGVCGDWIGGKVLLEDDAGMELKTELAERHLQDHINYWEPSMGDAVQGWRFELGFEQGWNDARMFFEHSAGSVRAVSQLGFVEEWSKRRTAEHVLEHGDDGVFHFEHGLREGVAAAEEACLI